MDDLKHTINDLNNKEFLINGESLKIKSFTGNTVIMINSSGDEKVINLTNSNSNTNINNNDNQTSDSNMTEVNKKIMESNTKIPIINPLSDIKKGGYSITDSTEQFFSKNFGISSKMPLSNVNYSNNNKNGLFFVKYGNKNMKGGHAKNIKPQNNDIFNSDSTDELCGI